MWLCSTRREWLRRAFRPRRSRRHREWSRRLLHRRCRLWRLRLLRPLRYELRCRPPGQTLRIPSAPVYFDGRPVSCEAPTVIAAGRAIVPFRAVIEEAGGTVTWDSAARRAGATARKAQIAVTIGTDIGTVNDRSVRMGTAAAIRCDRRVGPLRLLG